MHKSNKVLLSLAAAQLASAAQAKSIHSNCLEFSSPTLGSAIGEQMSNSNQLANSLVNDEMRPHSVKTCRIDESVTGIQIILANNAYKTNANNFIKLDPLGSMTGNCDTVKLPGDVNKIKASKLAGDMSIEYKIYGQLNQKYGELDSTYSKFWHFTDSNPLVGLYGYQSEAGIEELGFITLNTSCQSQVIEQQSLSALLDSASEMTKLNSKEPDVM